MSGVSGNQQPIQFQVGKVSFSAEELQKCIEGKKFSIGRLWANIKLSSFLGRNVNETFVKKLLGSQDLETLQNIQRNFGSTEKGIGTLAKETMRERCIEFVEKNFPKNYDMLQEPYRTNIAQASIGNLSDKSLEERAKTVILEKLQTVDDPIAELKHYFDKDSIEQKFPKSEAMKLGQFSLYRLKEGARSAFEKAAEKVSRVKENMSKESIQEKMQGIGKKTRERVKEIKTKAKELDPTSWAALSKSMGKGNLAAIIFALHNGQGVEEIEAFLRGEEVPGKPAPDLEETRFNDATTGFIPNSAQLRLSQALTNLGMSQDVRNEFAISGNLRTFLRKLALAKANSKSSDPLVFEMQHLAEMRKFCQAWNAPLQKISEKHLAGLLHAFSQSADEGNEAFQVYIKRGTVFGKHPSFAKMATNPEAIKTAKQNFFVETGLPPVKIDEISDDLFARCLGGAVLAKITNPELFRETALHKPEGCQRRLDAFHKIDIRAEPAFVKKGLIEKNIIGSQNLKSRTKEEFESGFQAVIDQEIEDQKKVIEQAKQKVEDASEGNKAKAQWEHGAAQAQLQKLEADKGIKYTIDVKTEEVGGHKVGVAHVIGRVRNQIQEDTDASGEVEFSTSSEEKLKGSFHSICDGHQGTNASRFIKKHMKDTIEEMFHGVPIDKLTLEEMEDRMSLISVKLEEKLADERSKLREKEQEVKDQATKLEPLLEETEVLQDESALSEWLETKEQNLGIKVKVGRPPLERLEEIKKKLETERDKIVNNISTEKLPFNRESMVSDYQEGDEILAYARQIKHLDQAVTNLKALYPLVPELRTLFSGLNRSEPFTTLLHDCANYDVEKLKELFLSEYSFAEAIDLGEAVPSGATMTLFLQLERGGKKEIWTANAGDSRIVYAHGDTVRQLTKDAEPVEWKKHVERRGGEVKEEGGKASISELSVASAIGDRKAARGVSPKSGVGLLLLDPSEKGVLILGCDGLWDVATSAEVGQVATNQNLKSPADVSTALVQLALERGTRDNTSVTAVYV